MLGNSLITNASLNVFNTSKCQKTTNAAPVYHDKDGARWFSNLTKNIQCKIVGSLLTFNGKNKSPFQRQCHGEVNM